MKITKAMIDKAEKRGACWSAREWLRAKPRTTRELIKEHPDWAEWHLSDGGNFPATDVVYMLKNSRFHASLAQYSKDPEVLRKLANNEDWWVRYNVADNRRAPTKVLAKLANDAEPEVRHALVCNIKTPIRTLRRLAADTDRYTAEAAQSALYHRTKKGKK